MGSRNLARGYKMSEYFAQNSAKVQQYSYYLGTPAPAVSSPATLYPNPMHQTKQKINKICSQL